MASQRISDLTIYKYRHIAAIVGLAGLLISLLYVVAFIVPNGVSSLEEQSIVEASALQTETMFGEYPEQIANAPYHLLQRGLTELFGLSSFTIKLPSLILAAVSMAALYSLLRIWFRKNVAVITTIVAMTSAQFLLVAQLGNPKITYIFLSVAMLFCASMLTQGSKFRILWLLATTFIAAVSMYTPLMWYFVIAMFIIALIHPHSRFILMRVEKWALLLAFTIFSIINVPLILSLINNPELTLRFLGVNFERSLPDLLKLKDLVAQYVGFTNSSSTETITPVYGLGVLLLVLLGLYRLFSAKYTAKSYILTAWLLLLLPAVILLPTATTLTFIPIMLIAAFAFDYLFGSWYGLFPHNPYARVFGLVPLTILIVTLSISSVGRFVYGYHYDQAAAATFTRDLSGISATLDDVAVDQPVTLNVREESVKFYEYYKMVNDKKNLTVTNNQSTALAAASNKQLVVSHTMLNPLVPSNIIVSSNSEASARFYIYK